MAAWLANHGFTREHMGFCVEKARVPTETKKQWERRQQIMTSLAEDASLWPTSS